MSTYLDLYNPRRALNLNGNLLPMIGSTRGLEPDPQIQRLLKPLMDAPVQALTDQVASRVWPPLNGQFVLTPVVSNPEANAKAVTTIAEQIISQAPQSGVSEAAAVAIPHAVKATTTFSKFLPRAPLIPPLLKYSQVTHLRNIVVAINATKLPKNYCIRLGKGTNEQKIAFTVKAGSPVRFLSESGDENLIPSMSLPPTLFQGGFGEKFLGPLKGWIWRRQEFKTDCTIFLDDPRNPLLKNGPAVATIPLSSNETIRVIQRDPKISIAPFTRKDIASSQEAAQFASMTLNSFDLTKKTFSNVRFPIVGADGQSPTDGYIHITQEDAPK